MGQRAWPSGDSADAQIHHQDGLDSLYTSAYCRSQLRAGNKFSREQELCTTLSNIDECKECQPIFVAGGRT